MTDRSARPILPAYADTGALEIHCSHCGAEPGKWCTQDDGRVRRCPCVERAVAGVSTGDGNAYAPRDFSEPRHPNEPTGTP